MPARRVSVLLFVVTALVGAGCSSSSGHSGPRSSSTTSGAGGSARIVGVSPNPGAGGQDAAIALFRQAGATGIEAAEQWNKLEPQPGRFDFGDVDSIVGGLKETPGDAVVLVAGAVETTARSVPGDLTSVAWDSAQMRRRYHALIDALVPHLSHQVRYVSVANEPDVYLSQHPAEWGPFGRFLADAERYLHRKVPWAKVGVTMTYDGMVGPDGAKVMQLARTGDVFIATYYPLGLDYRARAPQSALADIPKMVQLAAGKPLVLQEVGYPTSATVGGSEAAQATFVTDVFRAWSAHADAIPFLNVFSIHDFDRSWCENQMASYGQPGNPNGIALLCSLGLRHRDGSPKPAWSAFVAGVKTVTR